MARIEKVVNIKVDSSEAEKGIQEVDKGLKQIDKSTDEVNANVTKSSKLFKGLGTAIKATGIGLLIGLVAKLGQSFSSNNKVVTFFNTAMIGLNKAFNDLFNFIFNNFGKVTNVFKGIFENPQQSLKSFSKAIKDNLIERFNSLIDTLGLLGKAIKQVFEGDFSGALESAKEAGKELVDVYTGVDGTVDKVSKAVKEGTDAIVEYAKETAKTAEKINDLRSSFAQIENQQTRLREAADRDAEAQRRLRDDFTKNIDVRIKANEELAEVLNRQEKAEKASVQARINGLNTEQKLLGFKQERANEIFALQTELIAIEAQQAGFRAEQEANAIALQKERIDLNQTELDAQKQRQLDQLEFEAEQEEKEANKIIKLQERLDLENQLLEEDLERKRQLFAEGTQARIDAEQEFLTAKQELDQKEISLNKQKTENEGKQEKGLANLKQNLASNTFQLLGSLAKEGSALAKGVAIAQATVSTFQGINKALAETTDFTPTQSLRFANAAIVGASGFANIASILSTPDATTSAPSSAGGGSAPQVTAPSFNLVSGTGTDQIADTIQNQDRPIKAFVVSNDVTTGQELDRNAVEGATL